MGKNMSISYDQMSSPIGPLTLMTHENRLIRIDFGTIEQVQTKVMTYLSNIGTSIDFKATTIEHAIKQELNEYFLKQRFDFSIEHVFHGTHFQRDVWQALLRIPYGETVSYKQIAEWVGRPKAARAVGGAVNKNPFSIVVPCHRVIGANGQLVGYGGGIERKLFLLDHEKEAKKNFKS